MTALTDLTDVTITSPTVGDVLRYNGSGVWVNGTDGSALTALNASSLSSGTVPSARVSGSYSGITGVGTIASGTWQGTKIAEAYGGTNQSAYAKGDILYASGVNTLARLANGAMNSVLISGTWGVDGPSWSPYPYLENAAIIQLSVNQLVPGDDIPYISNYDHEIILNWGTDHRKLVLPWGLDAALSFGTHLTGTSYNGAANVTIGTDATNANTASTIVARDSSGNFSAGTITAALSGNASTASALQTARTINGVSFDGTANIAITASLKEFYVPAAAMWPSMTNGGDGSIQIETSTNKNNRQTMQAANTSGKKYFEFEVMMPSDYSSGTVTAKFVWSAGGTSTNSAVFGIQGVATGDGDAIDAAFGTAQEVTDAHTSSADRRLITSATSACTIAGSPAAGKVVNFRVYRDPDNGSDTLAQTVEIHGLQIAY